MEVDDAQQLALARDFVRRQFISQGMVADLAIHRYDTHNPHAHILLTTRRLEGDGFGLKDRSWNTRAKLLDWRIGWEEVTNAHLAQAGLAIRIDHRALKVQGLDLLPGRKIGVGQERRHAPNLPDRICERIAEQQRIAPENGERILSEPAVALSALTRTQATFTEHDLVRFLHTRTDGADQFRAAHLKVMASNELPLGRDDRGQMRYTSRELLILESDMLQRAERLSHRRGHTIAAKRLPAALASQPSSAEQRAALHELAAPGDLKALVGLAGSGKSRLLGTLREAWEGEGYTVKGAALSGIAAESLQDASGIRSRTLASYEYACQSGRDPLSPRDIVVIDEAGMVGTRQIARVLEEAEAACAKVVLVVALSRHRESATVFYAASDFGAGRLSDPPALEEAHRRMMTALSLACTQDLVHDYLDREPTPAGATAQPILAPDPTPRGMSAIDALQQQAADRWRERQLARERALNTPTDPTLTQQQSETLQSDTRHTQRKEHVHSRGVTDDFDI